MHLHNHIITSNINPSPWRLIDNLHNYILDGKTFIFLDGNIIKQHDPRSLCISKLFNKDFVVIKHNIFQQECSCNITEDISNSLGFEELTPEV